MKAGVVFVPYFSIGLYMFLLPWLSDYFNRRWWDDLGELREFGPVCTMSIYTPGLTCHNGEDLQELALQQNRTVLCGCTQGIFGEALCPIHPGGFTLSWFIGTAPAEGMFGVLSFIPTMQMWWYHDWVQVKLSPSDSLTFASYWSLWLFQVCWCIFMTCQSCLWVDIHVMAVEVVIAALVIHWMVMVCIIWRRPRTTRANIIIVFFCSLVFLSVEECYRSQVSDCRIHWWNCNYGFMFWECLILMIGWSLVPSLWFFGGLDLPVTKPNTVTLLE